MQTSKIRRPSIRAYLDSARVEHSEGEAECLRLNELRAARGSRHTAKENRHA